MTKPSWWRRIARAVFGGDDGHVHLDDLVRIGQRVAAGRQAMQGTHAAPSLWIDDERGEDPERDRDSLPVLGFAGSPPPANWNARLRQPREGIMLHYDGSASDHGAVEWLTKDPRCRVSYNWLVLDDGTVVPVAPASARAWHAGVCVQRTDSWTGLPVTDANSAFYGIAVAATVGDRLTEEQRMAVIRLCEKLCRQHNWDPLTRIVSHRAWASPPGRKADPEGPDPTRVVLSTNGVRQAVKTALTPLA